MKIWDRIRKIWERKEEGGGKAVQPLDALEAPEGPPKRRTSDEMIEAMLDSADCAANETEPPAQY